MTTYPWATHLPLIKAIMELYKPEFVLELGAGNYSTPYFARSNLKLVTIENNKDWINQLGYGYIRHHDCGLHQSQTYNETPQAKRKEILNYYSELELPNARPNLLFVDQYAGCRLLSLKALGHKFDLIIYHDAQCRGYAYHRWAKANANRYLLKTDTSDTVAVINKDIDLGKQVLDKAISAHIKAFKKDFPECKKMKLIIPQ